MPYVHLVIALALVEFIVFSLAVANARTRYNVPAPATSGHPAFERTFRAQMNTLEQLIVFVPAIVIFAHYLNPYLAAALGAVFIIGRAVFFAGYVRAAGARHLGFNLSAIPNAALLLGAIFGALRALLAHG
jgi:glutathione S-transferase